jgi:hypothetical protein
MELPHLRSHDLSSEIVPPQVPKVERRAKRLSQTSHPAHILLNSVPWNSDPVSLLFPFYCSLSLSLFIFQCLPAITTLTASSARGLALLVVDHVVLDGAVVRIRHAVDLAAVIVTTTAAAIAVLALL